MRIHTEPDFMRKSKESLPMSEQFKGDIEAKFRYLNEYLENLKMYSVSHKINQTVEKNEHGRKCKNLVHQNKIMNARKFTAICHEIRLIEGERNRLLNIINETR